MADGRRIDADQDSRGDVNSWMEDGHRDKGLGCLTIVTRATRRYVRTLTVSDGLRTSSLPLPPASYGVDRALRRAIFSLESERNYLRASNFSHAFPCSWGLRDRRVLRRP